jgi:hypothetical protein
MRPTGRKPKKDWTRTPEEEAIYQRMQAKCQARAKKEVMPYARIPGDQVTVGVASTENTPQLTWEKPTEGATGLMTTCKRYSCAKVTIFNRTTYELWVLVPGVWYRQLAVGLESFSKAKELAEKHVAGKLQSSAA